MLRAITGQQQTDNNRLWFSDDNHDLFVWLDDRNNPVAFQFSYDKHRDEHCIYWHQQRGFRHDRIDSGDNLQAGYKMTPILVPDGHFDAPRLVKLFQSICMEMDPRLARFIQQTLAGAGDD